MDMAVAPVEREGSDYGPWELPAGWCWAPLRFLTSFIGRGRGPRYVEENGVPVVNQKCIRWRKLETQHLRLTARDAFDRIAPELRLRKGDLLWNSTGTGTIGRAVVYDGSIEELTADSHVTIVRPLEIEPRYLGYFIETGRVQHLVDQGHVGSTNQRELPRAFVEDLLFPFAPLPEQRRIVERIDALFAEIAEGEAALEEARKGLETFRRALLKAAVTGELTCDWRETNKPVETGQDLLARTAQSRAGKASARRRGRRVANATLLDTSTLPKLPDGWAWAKIDDVVVEVDYGTSVKCEFEHGGVPVLRMGDVDFGSLRFNRLKRAPEGVSVPLLRPGDLVFNRTNSAELVGKCAVYQGELAQCSLASYLIRLRFDGLAPEFAELWINSSFGRQWIASNKSQQVGQANLSGGTLRSMPIPVPPSHEATEIVRRVSEALSAQADTLAMLEAEAADAARLKQAILKVAFEGKLVEQDPDDEPASVALARLKTAPRASTLGRGRKRAVRE